MRDITFRGWYERAGVWVYVHVGQTMTEEGRKIYSEMCIDGVEWFQFTGLKDRNGKEIFVDDVIKKIKENLRDSCGTIHPPKSGDNFVVKCLKSGFTLIRIERLNKISDNLLDSPNVHGNINNYDFWNGARAGKIIGNIQENPELLEAK